MSGIINQVGSKSGVIDGLIGSLGGTCSFLARRGVDPSWASVTESTVLLFDNVSTGEGHDTDGCYDTSAYKFTVPSSGVYFFWFAVYCAEDNVSNGFQFKKNGVATGLDITQSHVNNLTAHHHSADDHLQNGSLVVTLTSGDYIQVAASLDSHVYIAHCSWGGCKLR